MKRLKKWAKPKKVKTPFTLFPSKSRIQYEPYGTVLITGPFNYPFQLVIEPLIGAIAAGNCVVLKPSVLVPHVSAVITQMIGKIFDKSYLCAVEGGIETNTSLIHARVHGYIEPTLIDATWTSASMEDEENRCAVTVTALQ